MGNVMMVPVPLFNSSMSVEAYRIDYQKGNKLRSPAHATAVFDGASTSPALQALNKLGIEAIGVEQPIFVPVSSIMLLGDLASQCSQPPEKVIFLFGKDLKPEEPYLTKLTELKEKGFRIAFSHVEDFRAFAQMCHLGDFVFLNVKRMEEKEFSRLVDVINLNFRNLSIVATEISTFEMFQRACSSKVSMFEGPFYRIPLTAGQSEVSPLKANLVRLLNMVRDDNFEFEAVADIIQRDTALTVSLMRLVNSPFIGLSQKVKNIKHAVTILGQDEVRKWVTMSVSRLLGADKPNEITRLSLIRAKFAEELAGPFGLQAEAQSLFLMGLFSVLDVILEVPMEKAFEMVSVSDEIYDCLVKNEGPYYKVFDFMKRYEAANWPGVSHAIVVYDLELADVYQAYLEALTWYSELILEEIRPSSKSGAGSL